MTTDHDLAAALATATRFRQLWHLDECASTQDLAAGSQLRECTVFWADHQTRGRGRQQRTWADAPGLDLLATFAVLDLQLPNPLAMPAMVPLAVTQALEPALGRELRIKWPNDVFLDGRKLAGVLIDARGERLDSYLIGIGINVNRTQFPAELGENATSLALATGRVFDRHELLLGVAVALEAGIEAIRSGDTGALAARFAQRFGLVGRRVAVLARGVQHFGVCESVDFERLRLDCDRAFPLGELQSVAPA